MQLLISYGKILYYTLAETLNYILVAYDKGIIKLFSNSLTGKVSFLEKVFIIASRLQNFARI